VYTLPRQWGGGARSSPTVRAALSREAGGTIAAMNTQDLLTAVDRLAPFELAEPWDKVGLQVGSAAAPVSRVLVVVDVDDDVVDEAAKRGCEVILAHHPLLFEPVTAVTDGTLAGRAALRAARAGIAVVVAHTNLDKARGGLADVMCAELGLENVAPLTPATTDWCKLVGFVPVGDLDTVREAIFAAGAGSIGEYVHCSFVQRGEGGFVPRPGAHPAVGIPGEETHTEELRLEVVFPRALRRQVLDAFVASHSYEEPAFDVYPVENEIRGVGLGRVGYLPAPMTLRALATMIAEAFKLPSARFSGDADEKIRRVACLPGSGGSLVEVAIGACDALVTGDVKYHDADRAARRGLGIVDVPHDVAEQAALERWSERLAEAVGPARVAVEFYRRPRALWQHTGAAPAAPQRRASASGGAKPAAGGSAAASGRPTAPSAGPKPASRPSANAADARHHLYVDGGARGNPGPAGIGARLTTADGDVVEELADYIGKATNNVAEYQALVAGLELSIDHGVSHLTVFADSELVVKQMKGEYKVKDATLRGYHQQASRLFNQIQDVEIKHIPREQNEQADSLVNMAIDEALA
jgi:dinuclear metal center YbgI/SA1388 family protein